MPWLGWRALAASGSSGLERTHQAGGGRARFEKISALHNFLMLVLI